MKRKSCVSSPGWLVILVLALLMIPFSALGEEAAVCPVCGEESAGLFCSWCGARLARDEGLPELTDTISRAEGRLAYQTTDELAALYGIAKDAEHPVYTPKVPEPMNAYLAIDPASEISISGDGLYPFSTEQIRYLSPRLEEWAEEIEDESLGAIQFVGSPDEADILIVARQTFPFSSYYGYARNVRGYSCRVELNAYRLSDPSQTARLYKRNDPPSTVSIRAGSTTFWQNPPELEGSKELEAFVTEILGWYGYGIGEEAVTLALQQALLSRGAYAGPADGQDSPALRYAVKQFQYQLGLPATGYADKATLAALYYSEYPADETADQSPALPEGIDTTLTRTCASCGWIYAADEDCAYCNHCGTALVSVYVGRFVRFGTYEQDNDMNNGPEAIEWLVLDIKDGKALLLSRYGLDAIPFSTEKRVSWETCTLRTWLNADFMDAAFTAQETAAIVETTVKNDESQVLVKKWNNSRMNADTGNNTLDRVFLLTIHEAVDVYQLSDTTRKCAPTDYAIAHGAHTGDPENEENLVDGRLTGTWWSRMTADSKRWAICMSGGYNFFDETYVSVRPALWVDLAAHSF